MKITDIFKDDNDINEKTVVGFWAFIVMTLFAFADLFTGLFGNELVISDTVYNSFVIITLGTFGIGEVGKVFGNKNENQQSNQV